MSLALETESALYFNLTIELCFVTYEKEKAKMIIGTRQICNFKTLSVCFALITNCTTNKNKPQEIDTAIEMKGSAGATNVGLNPNGEAVVQEQRSASVELMSLQHVNENLQMI
jgi:hypothetical protein